MGGGMVLYLAVVIVAIVLLVRWVAGGHRTAPSPRPEELLARRYANGELDDAEYRHRLETLRTGPAPVERSGRPRGA